MKRLTLKGEPAPKLAASVYGVGGIALPPQMMHHMGVTDEVYLDEFCLFLGEMVLPPKDGRGMYRIQVIQVWRPNGVKSFPRSLGSSPEMLNVSEFTIPGARVDNRGRLIDHDSKYSVAKAIHTADKLRYLLRNPPSQYVESRIITAEEVAQEMIDIAEDRQLEQVGRSTFGPGRPVIRP